MPALPFERHRAAPLAGLFSARYNAGFYMLLNLLACAVGFTQRGLPSGCGPTFSTGGFSWRFVLVLTGSVGLAG